MKYLRYYVQQEESENVLKITTERDMLIDSFIEQFNELGFIKNCGDLIDSEIKGSTTFYFDRDTKSLVVRFKDKRILLMSGDALLKIWPNKHGYVYRDSDVVYSTHTIDTDLKCDKFERITKFMRNFRVFDKHLPIDSTTSFMFSDMNLLDLERYQIIASDDDVLLCLNDFRKVNPGGMNLTVADAKTYEVVGSIEYALNIKGESNFSYSGNVEYKCDRTSYASKALALLKKYINDMCEEYNQILYLTSAFNDKDSETVAIDNGGQLEYEGCIPKSDAFKFRNKKQQIKIYRIENN